MLLFALIIVLAGHACIGLMGYYEPTMIAAANIFGPLAQAAPVIGIIASQALMAVQPAALMSTWARHERTKTEADGAVLNLAPTIANCTCTVGICLAALTVINLAFTYGFWRLTTEPKSFGETETDAALENAAARAAAALEDERKGG